jgi:hypothetical protein
MSSTWLCKWIEVLLILLCFTTTAVVLFDISRNISTTALAHFWDSKHTNLASLHADLYLFLLQKLPSSSKKNHHAIVVFPFSRI